MGLCANSNDPHAIGPVFAPLTGLSSGHANTAASGKTNIPGMYFPLVAIYGGRTVKASPSVIQLLPKRLVVQAHPGMPQICHNLTRRGVSDQEFL